MTLGCKNAALSSGSCNRQSMEKEAEEVVSFGENLCLLCQEEEVKDVEDLSYHNLGWE